MSEKWTNGQIKFVQKCIEKGHSRTDIARLYRDKFNEKRSPNSIKHCIENYCNSAPKYLPKILVLDIETAPLQAYAWGLFDQNIPLDMIIQDWFILSWSAKWLGEPESKVMYKDQRNKKGKRLTNDKPMLKKLWKLMDEADVILGQSSIRFDLPRLNARFIKHKMGPPSTYKKLDTLKMARKYFGFSSNKLAAMSDNLCVKYKKLDHGRFPGTKLWTECLKGNINAWREMESYNIRDIMSTEELFTILAEFDNNKTTVEAMATYRANRKKK